MATYKVNKGTPVAFRDGAYPTTYPSPHEGELFYNGGTGAFQFLGVAVAAWSTGGALNTGRQQVGGSGDTPASLAFGGIAPARKNETETYNGTAWTEVNNLTTARTGNSGFGTVTSALVGGGETVGFSALTEVWDGTSWAEGDDYNTAGDARTSGSGSSGNSGLAAGGRVSGNNGFTGTEEWLNAHPLKTIDVS
jgi:hypothetical protein